MSVSPCWGRSAACRESRAHARLWCNLPSHPLACRWPLSQARPPPCCAHLGLFDAAAAAVTPHARRVLPLGAVRRAARRGIPSSSSSSAAAATAMHCVAVQDRPLQARTHRSVNLPRASSEVPGVRAARGRGLQAGSAARQQVHAAWSWLAHAARTRRWVHGRRPAAAPCPPWPAAISQGCSTTRLAALQRPDARVVWGFRMGARTGPRLHAAVHGRGAGVWCARSMPCGLHGALRMWRIAAHGACGAWAHGAPCRTPDASPTAPALSWLRTECNGLGAARCVAGQGVATCTARLAAAGRGPHRRRTAAAAWLAPWRPAGARLVRGAPRLGGQRPARAFPPVLPPWPALPCPCPARHCCWW